MSSSTSNHVTGAEHESLLSKTLHSEVALSDSRMALREFAHRKFIPAIKRAQADDDTQQTFTSAATNLAMAGWILTELALRAAELAEKKNITV
jgi:uncharacterized protein YhbP (UPF0306 family)